MYYNIETSWPASLDDPSDMGHNWNSRYLDTQLCPHYHAAHGMCECEEYTMDAYIN